MEQKDIEYARLHYGYEKELIRLNIKANPFQFFFSYCQFLFLEITQFVLSPAFVSKSADLQI